MPPKDSKGRFSDDRLNEFYDEFVQHMEGEEASRKEFLLAIERNTVAVNGQAKSTADLVAAWNNAQGFLSVMVWISRWIKILTPIAIVLGAIFYFIKTGTWTETE